MSAVARSAEVRVVEGPAELAQSAAHEWRARALAAVASSGRFTVALAGGKTPGTLYRLLAEPAAAYREELPWARTHVFFGDERAVPPDDPRSNYGMARDALLAHVALPPENVHRIRGEGDPVESARAYEEELRAFFGAEPRFDLALLGLGTDGHTASLFPGSAALEETSRLVATTSAPGGGARRITMTLRALDAAARVVFLVAGASKAAALARVVSAGAGAELLPAARVRPRDGTVLWLVDRAAAAMGR